MSTEPVLQARGLVKRYGRVIALDNADFDLYPGEILGVIGDNGAGKSTLIKALCGAVIPDAGEIKLAGNVVNFQTPLEARQAGIETVYQDLALSPALSIADNMFLGREMRMSNARGRLFRTLDRRRMQRIAREKLSDLGLMTIQNINQPVETLSGGQRQGVAVARAAAFGSRVVIMDEPTRGIDVGAKHEIYNLIFELAERGCAVIVVSSELPELIGIADRMLVMRAGAITAEIARDDFSEHLALSLALPDEQAA